MKILMILLILLCPLQTFAAPYIVSDNATEFVTNCKFDGVPIECSLDRNHISVDAGDMLLAPGIYTLRAQYCVREGTVMWCSDWSAPFRVYKTSSSSTSRDKSTVTQITTVTVRKK
jgi:hypothetical protein